MHAIITRCLYILKPTFLGFVKKCGKQIINIPKGQLISECLFDFLNFPKNHRKI